MSDAADRPTAAEAACRLLILKHQYAYASILPPPEVLAASVAAGSPQEGQELVATLEHIRSVVCGGLESAGLWAHLAPDERAFFAKAATAVTRRDCIDISWTAESAACLSWALGKIPEVPPYDEQVDPELVKFVAGDDSTDVVEKAVLRHQGEIERARNVAELWHWRSRTRQLEEQGFTPPADSPLSSLREIVGFAAREAYARGEIGEPIDDDFPVRGKPYRSLSTDEWAVMTSIAMERHKAFNWLCGLAPGNHWQDTSTDT